MVPALSQQLPTVPSATLHADVTYQATHRKHNTGESKRHALPHARVHTLQELHDPIGQATLVPSPLRSLPCGFGARMTFLTS